MRRLLGNKKAVSQIVGFVTVFLIGSVVAGSSLYTIESLIDSRVLVAGKLQAQAIANHVTDVLMEAVAVNQSFPNARCSQVVHVPSKIGYRSYYIEITNKSVYVNSTDGSIQCSSTTYGVQELDINITGKICVSTGEIEVFYNEGRIGLRQPSVISDSVIPRDWWNTGWQYRKKLTINHSQVAGDSSIPSDWWHENWQYRKKINIINNHVSSTLKEGYSICFTLNALELIEAGKMLADGSDLRIVWFDGIENFELNRTNENAFNTDSTDIWFKLQEDIPGSGSDNNYYIYYGNPSAADPPDDRSNIYLQWDDFDDSNLGSEWAFSLIGGAAGSVSESGSAVRLTGTDTGDLWGKSDKFVFLNQDISGGFEATAYISAYGGSISGWAKVGGVAIRQSTAAGSRNRISSPAHPSYGVTNSYRLSDDVTTSEQTAGSTSDKYQRIRRLGDQSTAFTSADGVTWTEIGSEITFIESLSDPILVGIPHTPRGTNVGWVEIDWFKTRKYMSPEPTSTTPEGEKSKSAGGETSHDDFPILVSVTASSDTANNLRDHAQSDGDDILFTDSNKITQQLDHEIEYFNGDTGELVAWVRIPSLPSDVDTDIYMYYGNSGASNQENAAGTWGNYIMVYHLNEPSGTTGAGSVTDSTGSTSGTPSSGISFGQSGKIANSTDFSSGTGINCGTLGPGLLTAETTISFWIYANNYASPSRQNPFDHSYGGWGTMTIENTAKISWYFGSNGGDAQPYVNHRSNSVMANNEWIYISAVRNPTGYTYTWYKNGEYLSGSTYSSSYPNIQNQVFTIGDGYVRPINGKMDEFRISNAVRNDAWITTSYNTINDPSSFLSFGSEVMKD